jgi:chromosome segregation ATPase
MEPNKKTGVISYIRKTLLSSEKTTVTSHEIEQLLSAADLDGWNKKTITNIITYLRPRILESTGEKKGNLTVYSVDREALAKEVEETKDRKVPTKAPSKPATRKYKKRSESLFTPRSAELRIEAIQSEHKIEIDHLKKQHQDQISDLENKLLEHMCAVEDMEKQVKNVESGFDVDFVTLGKAVYRAHEELLKQHNAEAAAARDNEAKWKKMRSEDRSTIGSLQGKIERLERELKILRERIGQSNGKPDMGVFNSPRIILRKKGDTQ